MTLYKAITELQIRPSKKQLEYVKEVRLSELKVLLPFLRSGSSVLDFGAGPGHQAAFLSTHGYSVSAVDLRASDYAQDMIFPVTFYDGKTLPYSDGSFDAVISSNVLEHILHLDVTLDELQRVLKKDGQMIHVMPTTVWRFWTTVCAFPNALKEIILYFRSESADQYHSPYPRSWRLHASVILRALLTPWAFRRHGERGNALTELFTYRKAAWIKLFRTCGFNLAETKDCHLFYTGNMFFADAISPGFRKRLSIFLGSSTRAYIVKK